MLTHMQLSGGSRFYSCPGSAIEADSGCTVVQAPRANSPDACLAYCDGLPDCLAATWDSNNGICSVSRSSYALWPGTYKQVLCNASPIAGPGQDSWLFLDQRSCAVIPVRTNNGISSTATSTGPSRMSTTSPSAVQSICALATPAPSGATCFTVTGHGHPRVDGSRWYMHDGYSNPQFSFPDSSGYFVATYYLDNEGHM